MWAWVDAGYIDASIWEREKDIVFLWIELMRNRNNEIEGSVTGSLVFVDYSEREYKEWIKQNQQELQNLKVHHNLHRDLKHASRLDEKTSQFCNVLVWIVLGIWASEICILDSLNKFKMFLEWVQWKYRFKDWTEFQSAVVNDKNILLRSEELIFTFILRMSLIYPWNVFLEHDDSNADAQEAFEWKPFSLCMIDLAIAASGMRSGVLSEHFKISKLFHMDDYTNLHFLEVVKEMWSIDGLLDGLRDLKNKPDDGIGIWDNKTTSTQHQASIK